MTRIGVRELRHRASTYLARAKAGEIIEITDRGVPVARLVPPLPPTVRDQLIAEGRLKPGAGRLLDHVDPLPQRPDGRRLSQLLDEIREERT
jgi:prevent-host-death family protein